ncbi:M57 family metalloprotease [Spirosoma sp. 209]|uniref:M57 family metalloprotease n=1 Tax=Spirosoma sp. 209 TaxID=1955701 RepID=UPI00137478B0|nr:M57 family metalloprotease [Spirosoma sp. 209]
MQPSLPANWSLTGLVLASLLLLNNACQPVTDALTPQAGQVDNSPAVRAYIRSLGCPDSLIHDAGDHFIADGDLLFPKDMAVPGNGAQEEQTYRPGFSIHNGAIQRNIKVGVADVTLKNIPGIEALVRKAIANWSQSPLDNITLTYWANPLTANITIGSNDFDVPIVGVGKYIHELPPTNGNPPKTIVISTKKFNELLPSTKLGYLTHALGHALGFAHTDWRAGEAPVVRIMGSPAVDNASIMNRIPTATAPSGADINALRVFYPATVYNIKVNVVNKPNAQKAFSISLNGPVHHIKGFLFRYYINHKIISNGTLAYNPTYGTGEQGYSYAPKPAPAANQYTLETRQIQTYGSDITYKQTWYLQFNVRIRYADGTLGPWLAQDQKFTGEFK